MSKFSEVIELKSKSKDSLEIYTKSYSYNVFIKNYNKYIKI